MKKSFLSALLIAVPIMASAQLPAPRTIFPETKSTLPPGMVEYAWEEVEGAAAYWLQAEFLQKHGWVSVVDVYVPPLSGAAFGMSSTGSVRWRVAAVDPQGAGGKWSEWVEFRIGERTLSVQELPGLPESFSLAQNYPNPFNPSTTIRFELLSRTPVRLTVHNTLGQEITTLVNETLQSGVYETTWDARDVASGTYFYRLTSDQLVQTKKMVLMK